MTPGPVGPVPERSSAEGSTVSERVLAEGSAVSERVLAEGSTADAEQGSGGPEGGPWTPRAREGGRLQGRVVVVMALLAVVTQCAGVDFLLEPGADIPKREVQEHSCCTVRGGGLLLEPGADILQREVQEHSFCTVQCASLTARVSWCGGTKYAPPCDQAAA